MSILLDYEKIRKEIGENEFSEICKFLDCHKQYFLSDIYYNEKVHKKFKKWKSK